jgi:hypothetical protein
MRGEVDLILKDGRKLILSMSFRALGEAAAETGIPAAELFDVLRKDDGRQTKALLALIEASLKKHHRNLTPDDVDDFMIENSEALGAAVSDALNSAFAEDSGEVEPAEAKAGNAKVGTGTSSKKTGQK